MTLTDDQRSALAEAIEALDDRAFLAGLDHWNKAEAESLRRKVDVLRGMLEPTPVEPSVIVCHGHLADEAERLLRAPQWTPSPPQSPTTPSAKANATLCGEGEA